MKIVELFEAIKNEPSTLGKKQLIGQNLSEVLKQIFIDTYDTSKKYYIKNFPNIVSTGDLTIDNDYNIFHEILDRLAKREVTGNDAIDVLIKTLEQYSEKDIEILINIVQRNLKIGVSILQEKQAIPKSSKPSSVITSCISPALQKNIMILSLAVL